MEHVSSGRNIVIGVNAKNDIYKRLGITDDLPTGTSWVKIPGKLKVVDAHARGQIWGVNVADKIYYFGK